MSTATERVFSLGLAEAETPWGKAGRFCRAALDGLWACGTHSVEVFADRAEMAVHVDTTGPCVFVWRCRTHGPEGRTA